MTLNNKVPRGEIPTGLLLRSATDEQPPHGHARQPERLLWVKNGSGGASKLCLRYPTKQTSTPATATSVSCYNRTFAVHSITLSAIATSAGERRTRREQMSFGSPLKADIARCSRHVSKALSPAFLSPRVSGFFILKSVPRDASFLSIGCISYPKVSARPGALGLGMKSFKTLGHPPTNLQPTR